MKNEVDNFLEDVNKKNDDPFTPEVADPFEKKEETKVEPETTTEGKEEKPLPFHKDPKVQRFIEKEVAKKLGEIKPNSTQQEVKDEIEEVLIRVIGNDTPEKVAAVKDMKRILSGIEDKGAQKALTTIQKQQTDEREAEEKAVEELNEGLEGIQQTFNVDITSNSPAAKKTRSEFIEFIKRVSPKDSEGQIVQFPDLQETWTVFQDVNKSKTPSRAKQLVTRSMDRSADASSAPTTTDNSWGAVDKAFSKFN